MKLKPPIKTRTDLPEALQGMEGKYFVRRHAATHAEAARNDVIFGVKDIDDLLERTTPAPPKTAQPDD
jgi:hypothetical protein